MFTRDKTEKYLFSADPYCLKTIDYCSSIKKNLLTLILLLGSTLCSTYINIKLLISIKIPASTGSQNPRIVIRITKNIWNFENFKMSQRFGVSGLHIIEAHHHPNAILVL